MVWTETFGGEDNGRLEKLEGKRYKVSQRGRSWTFWKPRKVLSRGMT